MRILRKLICLLLGHGCPKVEAVQVGKTYLHECTRCGAGWVQEI